MRVTPLALVKKGLKVPLPGLSVVDGDLVTPLALVKKGLKVGSALGTSSKLEVLHL